MPEISCNAHKCVYNEQGYCEKENIRIDTSCECEDDECTCCDSFESNDNLKDCNCCGCAGENAGVECFATDCIYNHNKDCIADYISVEGSGATRCTDTFCDTYRS